MAVHCGVGRESGWASPVSGLAQPGPPPTVVLDDLSEVVSHEIPQGALVGEAQAVREEHRCVHDSAVDDLWEQPAHWGLRTAGLQRSPGLLPARCLHSPAGPLRTEEGQVTFKARRSLSRLCPMRMVSALNKLSRTAWTSRSEMLVSARSASVTPENLGKDGRDLRGLERPREPRPGTWGPGGRPYRVL